MCPDSSDGFSSSVLLSNIRLRKIKNATRVVACEFHKEGEFTGKELLGYPEFVFTAYIFEDNKCVRQVEVAYSVITSDRKENFR